MLTELMKRVLFRGTWFSQDSDLREYDALLKIELPNSEQFLIFKVKKTWNVHILAQGVEKYIRKITLPKI